MTLITVYRNFRENRFPQKSYLHLFKRYDICTRNKEKLMEMLCKGGIRGIYRYVIDILTNDKSFVLMCNFRPIFKNFVHRRALNFKCTHRCGSKSLPIT